MVKDNNLGKYVLLFLAIVYIGASIAEVLMVTNGAEAVFESVKSLVPHYTMFILGYYFSKKE